MGSLFSDNERIKRQEINYSNNKQTRLIKSEKKKCTPEYMDEETDSHRQGKDSETKIHFPLEGWGF